MSTSQHTMISAVNAPSGITDSDLSVFIAITARRSSLRVSDRSNADAWLVQTPEGRQFGQSITNTVALVPDSCRNKMNVDEFPARILTNDDSILSIQSNDFIPCSFPSSRLFAFLGPLSFPAKINCISYNIT